MPKQSGCVKYIIADVVKPELYLHSDTWKIFEKYYPMLGKGPSYLSRLDEYCDKVDIQPPICTFKSPAPQPLVEKAVQNVEHSCHLDSPSLTSPPYELDPVNNCAQAGISRFVAVKRSIYTCPKHPGYFVFLLPDESTGEKYCLNIPKEK